jgi:hypothetical protein
MEAAVAAALRSLDASLLPGDFTPAAPAAGGAGVGRKRGRVEALAAASGLPAPPGAGASARPWSRADYCARVATFTPSRWFAKPAALAPSVAARRGWVCVDAPLTAAGGGDGHAGDRPTSVTAGHLRCTACHAAVTVSSCSVGAAGDPARLQSEVDALVTGHAATCPWRASASPGHFGVPDVRSPPAQAPAVHAARHVLASTLRAAADCSDARAHVAAAAAGEQLAEASTGGRVAMERLLTPASVAQALRKVLDVHDPVCRLATALTVAGWSVPTARGRARDAAPLQCIVCGAGVPLMAVLEMAPAPAPAAPPAPGLGTMPTDATLPAAGPSPTLWTIAAATLAAARRAMAAIRGSPAPGPAPRAGVAPVSATKRARTGSDAGAGGAAPHDAEEQATRVAFHVLRSHAWWCPWVHPASTGLSVPVETLHALIAARPSAEPSAAAGRSVAARTPSPTSRHVTTAIAALTTAAFGGAELGPSAAAAEAAAQGGPRSAKRPSSAPGLPLVWATPTSGGVPVASVSVPGWLAACLSLAAGEA